MPQRPYLPQGDLATLITYPLDSSSISPKDLKELLTSVDLAHLEDGSESTNWDAKLSLGESQRLNLARLFFHRPRFAIIDESTSGCSMAIEEMLYLRCQELDIAYVTICHRPALKQYHDVNLNLKGDGSYEINPIDHESDSEALKAPRRNENSIHEINTDEASVEKQLSPEEQFMKERSGPYKHLAEDRKIPSRSLLSQLSMLLKIVLPGSYGKLGMFLGCIGLRTAAFHAFSQVAGRVLSAAIAKDRNTFRQLLLVHFGIDIVSALVEEGAVVLQNEISVVWTENLSKHLIDLYFRDNAFYNASNMDRRVQDPDQRILEAQELAQGVASVFAASLTPLIDIGFFGTSLYNNLGTKGVTPLLGYAALASVILSVVSPNRKVLNLKEKELESRYKLSQTRLKTHAESIAFLGGGDFEKSYASKECLGPLIRHQHRMNRSNSVFKSILYFVYLDVDSFSSVVTLPKLLTGFLQLENPQSGSERIQQNAYISGATERTLVSAGKLSNVFENLSSVMSSAGRITEMIDVLNQMHRTGKYSARQDQAGGSATAEQIVMSHADIVTPNGLCLMRNLDVQILPGKSLCVTGVNGSGKSSFFRVLSGLWPLQGDNATLLRPRSISLVPQKQYSYSGTLAHQVVYPHVAESYDKERVLEALDKAGIGYLVSRYEKGLEERIVFEDTLSLGEQQRMGFARILYSNPQFAALDECSDAVSVDQEEQLYRNLEDADITCITISKRLVLPGFHAHELQCGTGNKDGYQLK